ncbi:formyltransferase family protein [Cohaesibacter gelatinilyticus]|uniref:Methionyl-tRNA formyltransferase n=1 Tax=Cohaesibacter gelatinilyticus TaxID=372072 RepID=A0A285PJ21_9HYPH|nr:formyltransferase family protein [Cohaesibacter gelatinilyticus]SNZ20126.1 methionyl-tRNA formyltransferase [Cohaesibacter gelatinilyticus]
MRIVLIGAVEFSKRALDTVLALETCDATVSGVCTLAASTFNADHVDLKPTCDVHGVPCLYVDDINSEESLAWIRDKKPDVIFCFGWPRLLKDDLLRLAPMGVVGYHPTALPANRGRHPLIWALVLGLKETASTFFFMDAGADSGDILSQQPIVITETDAARSLYDKAMDTAMQQIVGFVPQLVCGNYQRLPQDHTKANTWRKRGVADSKIDWRMSAQSVYNLVRGLSHPYVGAEFILNDQPIKVWKARIVQDVPDNIEPGQVVAMQTDGPVVKCGIGAICLLDINPQVSLAEGTYL